MYNNQIVVPAIPQALKNKTFTASDIKWVKTINDSQTHSAYISPDLSYIPFDRVFTNSDGTFFCLQLNPLFNKSLNKVPFSDLILLFQDLKPNNIRCFTHLVTPIGNNVVPSPYPHPSDWNGRWVKVIAITGNQVANSIPFTKTMWQKVGFTGQWQNLSFPQGRIWDIQNNPQLSAQQLSALQNDIWNKFQPWII